MSSMLPVLGLGLGVGVAQASRGSLPPLPVREPFCPASRSVELQVKLIDAVSARAIGGMLSLPDAPAARHLLRVSAAWGARWSPLLDVSPDRVTALLARAAARSGREQPDLLAWTRVELPDGDVGSLLAFGDEVTRSPLVEHASLVCTGEPPPGDIAPTTPDYSSLQGYLGPDPGIDAESAWTLGIDGDLVTLADVEYGWITSHEDLVDVGIQMEAGHTVPAWVASYGWDHHGTAVLGETSAPDNGYGVTGLMPGAKVRVYPEYSEQSGSRRASAITSAAADLSPGDVILLEMQASGESGYGPAELTASVWTVTRAAVDAGIVVVGAAGNGNQDLDRPWYQSNYVTYGDSGAIIVGAGTADALHDRLGFSTHGSRVDMQAWGTGVFTTGYGGHAALGGDRRQAYTAGFGGTSSASPMVAAAAVAVQSYMLRQWGTPLDPADVRALLAGTGVAQGSGAPIGPLPDVAAALLALDDDGDGALDEAWGGADCDDADPAVGPAMVEIWYDGVDGDCDGGSDHDADGDGFDTVSSGGTDCEDAHPDAHPGGAERWYDGVDGDCDGASDYDADGDGHDALAWGGGDCDDSDSRTNPDAVDIDYDGLDMDCDGLDADLDGDGHASAEHGGLDCDDDDASVSPAAEETWYDGIDSDCSGGSDLDADGDGYDAAGHGGLDCDDADAAVHPAAEDPAYDGVDGDCDGETNDADGDGYVSRTRGGSDCDDADPQTHPGAEEVWYDGQDRDCSGGSDDDADGDGWDAVEADGMDCDDLDPRIHPGADDIPGDGLDADCDGVDPTRDHSGVRDADRAGAKTPPGCASAPGRRALASSLVGLLIMLRRRRP